MRALTTGGAVALALVCAAPSLARCQTSQGNTAAERRDAGLPPLDPPASVSLPAGGVEVPLAGPFGRPMVDLRVNGRGPYRFVVETGAGFSSLNPEVAAELGLAAADSTNPSVMVDSLSVGGGALRDFRMAIYPLGLPGVQGVLGLSAYHDLLLTVDYPRGRMRLDRGTLAPANGRDRLALYRDGDLWELDIEVAGRKGRAVLDTQGAGAFNTTPGNAAGVPFEAEPVGTGTSSGPGIGTQETRTGRVAGDVRVGDVVFRRPLVSLIPAPPGYPTQWNLGGPALRRFTLTLDQRSRVLQLARPGRAPVDAPPPLRTVGFHTQVRNGHRMVVRVTPGSEAERLGVAPGDEVVSVDGRPAAAFDATPWVELIQKDRVLTLVVRRGGAERRVTLTPTVQVG